MAAIVAVFVGLTASSPAQTDWTATLFIDPFPSPYLSDWEANPAVGQAIIENGTSETVRVRALLTLTGQRRGRIASAESRLFDFPPGSSRTIATPDLIDYESVDYDRDIEGIAIRTGRIPEDEYEICLRLEDESGVLLLDNICATFSIVYPDPPYLVYPLDDDIVTIEYPTFQWTPVAVPIGLDVHYVLRISEVLPGQSPAQSLAANVPQYEDFDLDLTSLQYPIDALPLQPFRDYAWQVRVLDSENAPPASNSGYSEIWTFAYAVDTTTPIVPVTLAGRVVDAATGAGISGARVTYRPVELQTGEGGDTSFVPLDDSLVIATLEDGGFTFSDARDESYFSITASCDDYETRTETGEEQYLSGDRTDYRINLTYARPGQRRLAGVLRDFYSNAPVPDARVVYHVVMPRQYLDADSALQTAYDLHPRKVLEATTDADGRFEFLEAADSSFFSLQADKAPQYLPAQDVGPNQRQAGDIDNYVLLIKPNAANIKGIVRTFHQSEYHPVEGALVHLTRTRVVHYQEYKTFRFFNLDMFVSQKEETRLETDDVELSAYTGSEGAFSFKRVDQRLPESQRDRNRDGLFESISESTVLGYSYRIAVIDDKFQPYETDTFSVSAGETYDTGEHLLNFHTGSIVGHIVTPDTNLAGATVYLYPPVRAPSREQSRSSSGRALTGDIDTNLVDTTILGESGDRYIFEGGWGNGTASRPEGEPLDFAQTGADGAYVLPGVPINDLLQPTDHYVIWVEADGYTSGAGLGRIDGPGVVDTVDVFVTRAPGIVHGQIARLDGAPVEAVRVELIPAGSGSAPAFRTVQSDGDGYYDIIDIPPGDYLLHFVKAGYVDRNTEPFSISYGDNITRDELLDAAFGRIAVTVRTGGDKPIPDVSIKSPQIPSLVGFTDADGRLQIIQAPADSVELRLRALGYVDVDTSVFVTEDSTLDVAITLIPKTGRFLVRVLEDAAGPEKRLSGIVVKLGSTGAITTDVDGEVSYNAAPVGRQKLIVGPAADTSNTDEYVPIETEVTVVSGPDVTPTVVRLTRGARMSGRVASSEDGTPVGGVSVRVEGYRGVAAVSDSLGRFSLRSIPADGKVILVASRAGYRTARLDRDWRPQPGDHIANVAIELQPSPLDSLFGFAVALDSLIPSGNASRAFGRLIDIPPTFGLKLQDPSAGLSFANVELNDEYRPTSDTVVLLSTEVAVDLFGIGATMRHAGGLLLEWVDSVQAGRISGDVVIPDILSKVLPETEWQELRVPEKVAPSFWAGGVNRGLQKYGITANDTEAKLKLRAVTVGLDYARSHIDSAGFHFFGSLALGSKITFEFEELLIGRSAGGNIALKAITIKTDPPVKIPLGVFTVVDSATTWDAAGFRARGAIVLDKLDREYGFDNLHISPHGDFLSVAVTADDRNGTIHVHGQEFQIARLEFGTDNWDSDSLPGVRYFSFSGKLKLSVLDEPVELQSLKYTEAGDFTGRVAFNQSKTFATVLTITLEYIEIGNDETRGKFVGFSGGVKFGAVKGLSAQAGNFRVYYDGSVSFDELAFGFIAGPAQVNLSVAYADGVFEGSGLLEVRPVFSAGAEFRYAGSTDWWIRIISGTRIPVGAFEIVQVSGGIGRQDDTWRFSLGGKIAPARADKGISLDIVVEVHKTPEGVIIYGDAEVMIASGMTVGRATIELNFPERRLMGSIVFAYDFEALKANAQLDIGVQFGEYWYIHGRASIKFLEFFNAEGLIAIGNNWEWQHDGKTQVLRGIYVELSSYFSVNGDWKVIRWGMYFDRFGSLYIGWNGDFEGRINMAGGAWAWIGLDLGIFEIDIIQASGSFTVGANISKYGSEWTAGARANARLEAVLGWCSSGGCWSICWKCYVRIFGACVFALPTGAKACASMHADINYSTSKGMDVSVGF